MKSFFCYLDIIIVIIYNYLDYIQGTIQRKYGRIVFSAARDMGQAVRPPGDPWWRFGGGKAPKFFCIKYAKTVIFRVNIE